MLRNPDNALPLYIMLVVVGLVLGKRWASVRAAIMSAGSKVKEEPA